MNDLNETQDVIEFVGVVIPPPDLDSILFKIEAGATFKQDIELSPGEARVLYNFLKEATSGARV